MSDLPFKVISILAVLVLAGMVVTVDIDTKRSNSNMNDSNMNKSDIEDSNMDDTNVDEFDDRYSFVQDIKTTNNTLSFKLTDYATYEDIHCYYSFVLKINKCEPRSQPTDSVTVNKPDGSIKEYKSKNNYESETIKIQSDTDGQYEVVLNYDEGSDDEFVFNRTENRFEKLK